MSVVHPDSERLSARERVVLNIYLISGLGLFVLLISFGLVMRTGQSRWLTVGPVFFYELMTIHGAGMVGTVGIVSSAVMWYFLRQYVRLSLGVFLTNYILYMVGVVMLLASIFVGHYAGGWTFLYPLPVKSLGVWSVNAAALFMGGLLVIGVGFLLFYLDAMRGVLARYGSLGRALGVQWLFGGTIDKTHPPTVVASTMVIIVNSLGILGGAVVLVLSLVNAYQSEFVLNALFAKNLIYFFGHVFVNVSIYMAVIAVYEVLPRYTGREWGVSRAFLWAWFGSTVMLLTVYPHHLLMDFALPHWMAVMAQVMSYANGLPVLTVTAYGALTNIHRSGIRWNMPASLLILSMFGWAAGVVPAIIDATISVNRVMHNTMWVPGHFHFYLLLGELPMLLGFMYFLVDREGRERAARTMDRLALGVYVVGGLTFVMMFLAGGRASVPRRWAVHLPQWIVYDRVASVGAMLVILAFLVFTVRICHGLVRMPTGGGRPADVDESSLLPAT